MINRLGWTGKLEGLLGERSMWSLFFRLRDLEKKTNKLFVPFVQDPGKDFREEVNFPKEYVGHLTGMGSANSKIANSNIFVQNVGKTTLKPIADHTQLLEPQGPLPLLKQQNNSDIVTPIIPGVLQYLLLGYDSNVTDYLVSGFRYGFGLHYQGPRCFRLSKNLFSALQNPVIVLKSYRKKLMLIGLLGLSFHPLLIISRFPQSVLYLKEPGIFRLIHHLSFPENKSINDHIPDTFCTVQYATLDDAVKIIVSLGKGCLIAKTDVESAFRVVQVRKEDHELLGFKWQGFFYYDKCLPMGCASSCAIFEKKNLQP